MHFNRTLIGSEHCPWKKRQAKINFGCIQSVDRFLQCDTKRVFGVQFSCMMNQDMRKVLMNAPIPFFIGISQSTSCNRATDAHMVEFILHPEQAGRDVSKALTIGQLSKEDVKILIETGERLNLKIATVLLDASTKLMERRRFLQLR